MPRTLRQEVNDLAVRLEDGGLPPTSARTVAQQIADAVGSHYYARGFADGQRSGPPAESLDDVIKGES